MKRLPRQPESGRMAPALHRDKLLALLDRYQARYPDEDVARFRRFVLRQPRCFERDCWDDGHVTGSAVVVDRMAVRVLLTHHAKIGRWLQLGGHADGDTDPLAVACREAAEESGLAVAPLQPDIVDLDIHSIRARGGDPVHFHYDVRFLLQTQNSESFTITAESLALKWVTFDDVQSVTADRGLLRLVAKCREFVRDTRGR